MTGDTARCQAAHGFAERFRRAIYSGALQSTRLTAARNERIYQCGQPNTYVYLVEHGRVKTVMHSVSGKECLLDIHPTGDIFGELGLMGGERADSAIAMVGTTVHAVPVKQFFHRLAAIGCLDAFAHYVIQRNAQQRQSISEFVTHDSEHRLASQLLSLGRKLGIKDRHLIRIEEKITHEELAGMVGTTRSRIGHFLKRFRESGMVFTDENCFLTVDERRVLLYLNTDS